MNLSHLKNTHVPWEDTLSYRVAEQNSFETLQLIPLELWFQHLQHSFQHKPDVIWFEHQAYLLLWTKQQQELGTERNGKIQENKDSFHTSTSTTLSKEIYLCPCNWSGFIIHWNAVPTQDGFRCTLLLLLSHLPNYIQNISKLFFCWMLLHKVLNFIQLWCSTCFKATWVMKDKSSVTLKCHFILNIMLPSL